MAVGAIGSFPQVGFQLPTPNAPSSTKDVSQSFAQTVSKFVGEVNQQQQVASEQIQQLADGKTENLHEVVLAVTQADLSFQMMLEVRNRLLDTYQELMRMQI